MGENEEWSNKIGLDKLTIKKIESNSNERLVVMSQNRSMDLNFAEFSPCMRRGERGERR